MRYIAGGYVAAPTDPAERDGFLPALAAIRELGGLELPVVDKDCSGWAVETIPADWELVVTAIPYTAISLRADPAFGLAAVDEPGRRRAVEATRSVRDAIASAVADHGRSVAAVELHSAPGRGTEAGASSWQRFSESLREIVSWDWHGARLVIEHCDALQPEHQPEKGFLSLDDEITAVWHVNRVTGSDVGMSVNWARSAIEGRSVVRPVEQVARLAEEHLLAGLVFSGVAPVAIEAMPAWADAHLAPAPIEPRSLLGEAEMVETLRAVPARQLSRLDFLGVKVAPPPGCTTATARAGVVAESLRMLDRARTLVEAVT